MSNKHLNLLCWTSKLPFLPPLLRVDSPWCHPVLPRYRLRSLKEKKTLWLRAPQTGVKTSKWHGGGTKNKTKIKLARRKGGPKKEEEVRYAMLQLGCRVLVRGSFMWQRPINHYCSLTGPLQLAHTSMSTHTPMPPPLLTRTHGNMP